MSIRRALSDRAFASRVSACQRAYEAVVHEMNMLKLRGYRGELPRCPHVALTRPPAPRLGNGQESITPSQSLLEIEGLPVSGHFGRLTPEQAALCLKHADELVSLHQSLIQIWAQMTREQKARDRQARREKRRGLRGAPDDGAVTHLFAQKRRHERLTAIRQAERSAR